VTVIINDLATRMVNNMVGNCRSTLEWGMCEYRDVPAADA